MIDFTPKNISLYINNVDIVVIMGRISGALETSNKKIKETILPTIDYYKTLKNKTLGELFIYDKNPKIAFIPTRDKENSYFDEEIIKISLENIKKHIEQNDVKSIAISMPGKAKKPLYSMDISIIESIAKDCFSNLQNVDIYIEEPKWNNIVAFKTKIYPNYQQKKKLEGISHACRKAYNFGVTELNTEYATPERDYKQYLNALNAWKESSNKIDKPKPPKFLSFTNKSYSYENRSNLNFSSYLYNKFINTPEYKWITDLNISSNIDHVFNIRLKAAHDAFIRNVTEGNKEKSKPKNIEKKSDEDFFPKYKPYRIMPSIYIHVNKFISQNIKEKTILKSNKIKTRQSDGTHKQYVKNIYKNFGKIRLKNKIPTKYMDKKLLSATISKDGDDWYMSFSFSLDTPIFENKPKAFNRAIGIDLGVKILVAENTGRFHKNDEQKKRFDILNKKIAKEQRKLDKRMVKYDKKKNRKNSKNVKKQREKIAKIHRKIRNIRSAAIHNITAELSKKANNIVIENLNVKNMSGSAKGTDENPGKNVAAKSGLNKAILSSGWGIFRLQLEQKSKARGGKVHPIDPRNTSITCSNCGYTSKENRISQSLFICEECGFEHNADVNAAKNILHKWQNTSI